MNFKIKIKEKDYSIEILEEEKDVKIKVGDKEFSFASSNNKSKQSLVPQMSIPKRDFSKKEVKAPIAGALSQIFVSEGDVVKEGQKLFTLSAMKMENEIVAEKEGKIKKILFKLGDQVKEGDVLITLV